MTKGLHQDTNMNQVCVRARVCVLGWGECHARRCATATPSPELQTGKTGIWRWKPQRSAFRLRDICFSPDEESCVGKTVLLPRNRLNWQQMVSLRCWRGQNDWKCRTGRGGDVVNDVVVGQDRYDNLDLDLECEEAAEAVSILTWNFS